MQQGGVTGQSRHNIATAIGLKKGRMQAHHMIKHCGANICTDSLAQPGNQVETDIGAQRHQDGNTHNKQHSAIEMLLGLLAKTLINDQSKPLPYRQSDTCGKYKRQQKNANLKFVGFKKLKQRQQHRYFAAGLGVFGVLDGGTGLSSSARIIGVGHNYPSSAT